MAEPNPPQPNMPQPGADPSMDDILASIRRILAEEETADTSGRAAPGKVEPRAATKHEVIDLDTSMIVDQPPARPEPGAQPAPAPAPSPTMIEPPMPPSRPVPEPLVAPEAAAASAASVGSLMRHLANERNVAVTRGGPSLEDVIRDEMRPLLKHWLDTHLPAMVERLVRAEIERVVDRSVS